MQVQCIYVDNLHVLIFCYSTTSLKSTESHLVTCGFSYNTRIRHPEFKSQLCDFKRKPQKLVRDDATGTNLNKLSLYNPRALDNYVTVAIGGDIYGTLFAYPDNGATRITSV